MCRCIAELFNNSFGVGDGQMLNAKVVQECIKQFSKIFGKIQSDQQIQGDPQIQGPFQQSLQLYSSNRQDYLFETIY